MAIIKAIPTTHTTPFSTSNGVTDEGTDGYRIEEGYSDEYFDKENFIGFANLYISNTGENDVLYHGFDVSALPTNAKIINANIIFTTGYFKKGTFNARIYSGNTLLKEFPHTPSSSFSTYTIDLTDVATYDILQNIGIDIVFTPNSSTQKIFRFAGASLNIEYEEGSLQIPIQIKKGQSDITKLYIGSNEIKNAFLGTNKIYG